MFGKILYYLAWPLLWFVTPLSRRVRVIVIYDNKCILVQNWFGSGLWDLPGGGIKFGESAEDAAVRELREELRLHVDDLRKLTTQPIVLKKGGLTMRLEYFQATISPDEEIVQNWEIRRVSWIPMGELADAEVVPEEVRALLSSSAHLEDDTL